MPPDIARREAERVARELAAGTAGSSDDAELDAILRTIQGAPPGPTTPAFPVVGDDPMLPVPVPEGDPDEIRFALYQAALAHFSRLTSDPLLAAQQAQELVDTALPPVDPIPPMPTLGESAAIAVGTRRVGVDQRPLAPAAQASYDASLAHRRAISQAGLPPDFQGPVPPILAGETPEEAQDRQLFAPLAAPIQETLRAYSEGIGQLLGWHVEDQNAEVDALIAEEAARGRTLADRARESLTFGKTVQRLVPFHETLWPELRKDRLAAEAQTPEWEYTQGVQTELSRRLTEYGEPFEVEEGMPAENQLMRWMRIVPTVTSAALTEVVERIPVGTTAEDPLFGASTDALHEVVQARVGRAATPAEVSAATAEADRTGQAVRRFVTLGEVLGAPPGALQRVHRESWWEDGLQGMFERVERGSSLEEDFQLAATARLGPEWASHGWWAGLALDALINWEGMALAPARVSTRVAREAGAVRRAVPSASWMEATRAVVDPRFDLGRFVGEHAVEAVERGGIDALPASVRVHAERVALEEHGVTLQELWDRQRGTDTQVAERVGEAGLPESARADLDVMAQARSTALAESGNTLNPDGAAARTTRRRRGKNAGQTDARPLLPAHVVVNNEGEFFGVVAAVSAEGRKGSAPLGYGLPQGIGYARIRGALGDPSVPQYTLRNAKGAYITPTPVDLHRALYLAMKRQMDGDVVLVNGQRQVARWARTAREVDGSVPLVADHFFAAPAERRLISQIQADASGNLGQTKARTRVRSRRDGRVESQGRERASPMAEVPSLDAVLRDATAALAAESRPVARGVVPRAEARAAARARPVERLPGETRQQARARVRAEATATTAADAGVLRALDPELSPAEAARMAMDLRGVPVEEVVAGVLRARLLEGGPVDARIQARLAAAARARGVEFEPVWRAARDAAVAAWSDARGLTGGRSAPDPAPKPGYDPAALVRVENILGAAAAELAQEVTRSPLPAGALPVGTLKRAARRAQLRDKARSLDAERLPGESRAEYRRRLRAEVMGRVERDARVVQKVSGGALRGAMEVAASPGFHLESWLLDRARELVRAGGVDALPEVLREAAEAAAYRRGVTIADVSAGSAALPKDVISDAAGDIHLQAITGAPPPLPAPPLPSRLHDIIRDGARLAAQQVVSADRLRMLPTRALVSPREYRRIMDQVGREFPSFERAQVVGRRISEKAEFHLPDAERLRGAAARAGIAEADLWPMTPGVYNHLRRQAIRDVGGVVTDARYSVRGQAAFVDRMLSALRGLTLHRRKRNRLGRALEGNSYVTGFLKRFAEQPAEGFSPEVRAEWELLRRQLAMSPTEAVGEFRKLLAEGAEPHEAMLELAGQYSGPPPAAVTLGREFRDLVGIRSVTEEDLVAAAVTRRAELLALLGPRAPMALRATDPVLFAQGLYRWAGDAQTEAALAGRQWVESVLLTQEQGTTGTIQAQRLAEVVNDDLGQRIYQEVFGQGQLFGAATVEALGHLTVRDRPLRVDADAQADALVAHALRMRQDRIVREAMQAALNNGLLVSAPRAGSPQQSVLAAVMRGQHYTVAPDGTRRLRFPEAEIVWAEHQLERWGIEAGTQAKVVSRQIGHRDVMLPAELAERLDSMTRAGMFAGRSPSSLPGYAELMGLWKASRLHGIGIPRPSYFLGSMIGSGPLLWATRGLGGLVSAAGSFLRHPAIIGDFLLRDVGYQLPDRAVTAWMRTRAGEVYTPDQLWDAARRGGLGDAQTTFETGRQLAGVVAEATRSGTLTGEILRRIRAGAAWWQEVLAETGAVFERAVRYSVYLDEVMRGTPPDRAALVAVNSLPNYRDLTDFEREVMRQIFTFYAFQRKSADAYTLALLKHPGRVMAQVRLARDSSRDAEPLVSRVLKMVTGAGDRGAVRSPIERGGIREEDLARLTVWTTDGVYSPAGDLNPLYEHYSLVTTPVGIPAYLLQMRMLLQPWRVVDAGSTDQRQLVQSLTPVGQALAIAVLNQGLDGPYDRISKMRIPRELRHSPLGPATMAMYAVGPRPWRDDPRLADQDATDLLGQPAVWAAGGDMTVSAAGRERAQKAWAETLLAVGGPLDNARALGVAAGLNPPPPDLAWGDAALAYPLGLRWAPSYSELELIRRARAAQGRTAREETEFLVE